MSLHTAPVKLRLVLDVSYLPNGVPTLALIKQLEQMIRRTIGNGGLTGDTPEAEVDEHNYQVVELPEPMPEEELASYMLQRIESGSLDLGEIPVKLARYGLMEPHAFVNEMRERLGQSTDGEDQVDYQQETTLAGVKPGGFEVIEVPIDGVYPFEVGSRVGSMFIVHDFSVTLRGAQEVAAVWRKKTPYVDLVIRHFTGKGLGVTDQCPPWTPAVKGVAPRTTAFWSNEFDPPVVGATVRVTLNDLGLGIVTGYAIEDGFLALMVRLKDSEARPDWHKADNPGNDPAIIFGNEFEVL